MTTDIQPLNWLPERTRPYGVLMRLDRPIGWWLLVLPAWWGIVLGGDPCALPTWGMMGLFLVGAIVMRGAGCVVNDLWDRDLDRQVARTKGRPLASGVVSVRQALVFLAGLGAIGLLILFQLPMAAILLGLLSVPLIVTYPLMKRITWWPQLFLGLTFNFGALIGWAAMTGGVDWPAVFLYAGGVFWTLSYDTVYACMDRADDARVGIKSTALRFAEKTKERVMQFYAIAMGLVACAVPLTWVSALFLIPLLWGIWTIYKCDLSNETAALRLFRGQRDIGLMIAVILLVYGL